MDRNYSFSKRPTHAPQQQTDAALVAPDGQGQEQSARQWVASLLASTHKTTLTLNVLRSGLHYKGLA